MFGIGGTELVIIVVVAFLFFGPDKLPEVARAVGKFMRQFKQIQDEVTSTIRSEMYEVPDFTSLPKLDGSDAKPAGETAAAAPTPIGSGWESENEEESEESGASRGSSAIAMPVGKARMPFLEHLGELRRRLFIVVVSLLLLTVAGYFFSTYFIDFVLRPVQASLPPHSNFVVNQSPIDAMTLRFKAGFYLAIIIDSPVIIWQVMAFFLPALKPKERRYVVPTFLAMVALFLGGLSFCYFLVLQPAFSWLLGQGVDLGRILPQVGTYFDMALLMLIVFGVAFQLPVIVFYLLIFNIVPYKVLRKNWRVVYVALLAMAAFGTPDWSPVTNLGLWGALIVLYEASMLLARVVLNRRLKAQHELEGEEPELESDAVEAEA